METKTRSNAPTKDVDEKQSFGVVLSPQDAEEYRAYKRRKKQTEITSAISASEGTIMHGEDVQRVCERAVRLKQTAVKLPLSKISQAVYYLAGSKVKIDCVVGAAGETLAKVKAYEARQAVKRKAGEITLCITPSLLDCCRYGEIRKEIKRVKRAAGKSALKVRVESAQVATPVSRVARIACEVGAKFFSVPYFKGCERFLTDLTNGCRLEVTGVEEAEDFKRLTEAGVGRIVTDRAWEIYAQWTKEADAETLSLFANQTPVSEDPKPSPEPPKEEEREEILPPAPTGEPIAPPAPQEISTLPTARDPETEYCCRLEGSQLKFL